MEDSQSVEELLAELYGGDPDNFVGRRGALVRQLRQGGRVEHARQIAAARRPTVSLWAADHLAEFAPSALDALLESGRRLREAQVAVLEGGAVKDLRGLLADHSDALQWAVDGAASFLDSRDREVSDAVRRRLQTTLRAVSLGPPELGEALAAGRLTAEQEPEGFGGFAGVIVQPPAPRPGTGRPKAKPAPKPSQVRPDSDLLARSHAAKSAADAQARLARQLEAEAGELGQRAERLTQEAKGAAAVAADALRRATQAADHAERLAQEADRAAAAVETVGH
ncbi:MAG: hypothetical protein DLM66_00625 [Candidatus Dormiibacter spiritus]|nr:MAG: hypothetical protein DLM66_00625 [Candidatus Dormibacteraeota bacterium]